MTSDNSSSEYESDESELEISRPVYIPKESRKHIVQMTREDFENRQREEREKEKQKEETKRKEVLRRAADEMKRDMLGEIDDEVDFNGVDDTDNPNDEVEYLAWKVRELRRMKRDKLERDQYILEMEELERRREMTDEQRRDDEMSAGIDRFKKDKGQMRFMQKYYHKGGFYQDMDILKRDYTAPTREDNFSKEVLPEVLQVRGDFGKAGRTKWTHLANEDTSRKDSGWNQIKEVSEKVVKRMAGMHDQSFDRPAAKKKKEN